MAKIAGMDVISTKASAHGAARMVCVVDKVGLEMDVMAHLGDLVATYVCLNHQVFGHTNIVRRLKPKFYVNSFSYLFSKY